MCQLGLEVRKCLRRLKKQRYQLRLLELDWPNLNKQKSEWLKVEVQKHWLMCQHELDLLEGWEVDVL
jgi:hypothetical protein